MALMSRLLDEALPLDPDGRRLWLERLSPEYQDLAPALREALLPEEPPAAGSKGLLTLPKLGSADAAGAVAASGLQGGARVGPYELIRPLGAGGMAQVWLARRADGAFKREVALKLPTLTHLRGDLEQRFARERDILASLEHPQIARFYDAGVDPSGLPYVAMEYVHGRPLTSWCDAHRLGISARLELFVQVLEGVQYAHEKHVVHRDLKPSNILVTESGQVRLLDFGVAKLLEAEEADQTPLTSVYGRALTPDYASPELLRGDPVEPRSDVYSLGVVLYELLTGVRPYRLQDAASIGLLEQAIITVEVKRPSTQIDPEGVATRATTREQLKRQLRGDLDAIALKALAKEPAERYPSAATLAEDLRRYFESKPIQAQHARFTYRLRKLVRRNKAVVGVGATAIAAILATVGYTLYRETMTPAKIAANEVAVSASTRTSAPATANREVPVTAFSPPAHSVAVLPFVNMSGDKEQEYFSDGLSEELLNSLARINELQVAARTSSFYFKGEHVDLPTIAHRLNVASILEGSVRRSGNTIRITAQLNNAVTGFHLWSQTYDRNLGDVLKLQTEIANAVATALKVALLGDLAAKIELGGTRNPAAFEAYLRATKAYHEYPGERELQAALAGYTEAIRLDPNYALAYADRSLALNRFAVNEAKGPAVRDYRNKAQADARKAIALVPDLAEGHLALAELLTGSLEFTRASQEYERALALAPGNAGVLGDYGFFAVEMGHTEAGLSTAHRAVALDPLNAQTHFRLGQGLLRARRYGEAIAALTDAKALAPTNGFVNAWLGFAYYWNGNLESARAACESANEFSKEFCFALIYEKLGRHADAESMLAKMRASWGDDNAVFYAMIYAEGGNTARALDWLETAMRHHDRYLVYVKTSRALDSLRNEPRFQAIERALKFPH